MVRIWKINVKTFADFVLLGWPRHGKYTLYNILYYRDGKDKRKGELRHMEYSSYLYGLTMVN